MTWRGLMPCPLPKTRERNEVREWEWGRERVFWGGSRFSEIVAVSKWPDEGGMRVDFVMWHCREDWSLPKIQERPTPLTNYTPGQLAQIKHPHTQATHPSSYNQLHGHLPTLAHNVTPTPRISAAWCQTITSFSTFGVIIVNKSPQMQIKKVRWCWVKMGC